jgi:hypothetical protein
MLLAIAAVLFVMWLLWAPGVHVTGGLIHLLVVLAVISLIVHLVRRPSSSDAPRRARRLEPAAVLPPRHPFPSSFFSLPATGHRHRHCNFPGRSADEPRHSQGDDTMKTTQTTTAALALALSVFLAHGAAAQTERPEQDEQHSTTTTTTPRPHPRR